jgi:GDP-4-dehydro-6-deoxy-D-mannose reductase
VKVFVTGSSGFVGSHLRSLDPEWKEVHGIDLHHASKAFDLRDAASVEAEMAAGPFDAVIHLAAQANVPVSFRDPVATFDINTSGTVRLLDALQTVGFAGRFLLVSSGDVYGVVGAHDLPVTESVVPRPGNPYAASKMGAEAAALSWGRRGDMTVIIARPFNHIGPGQDTSFAIARFAHALREMRAGSRPAELATGRLDVTRDFLDVRDVLASYLALLQRGKAGEIYNVCSGVERRLGDVLSDLIRLSGVPLVPTIDPALLRPVDLPRMVGSPSKLMADTGWAPSMRFEQTLSDVLNTEFKQ